MLERAHVRITIGEKTDMEVADFGLDDLERTGLEIVVYVNADRHRLLLCSSKDNWLARSNPAKTVEILEFEPPSRDLL